MKSYFYLDANQQQQGPVDASQLTSCGVTGDTYVWCEELSQKVKHMNEILTSVKEAFAEKKRIIKTSYPQELWIKYGVQDKR